MFIIFVHVEFLPTMNLSIPVEIAYSCKNINSCYNSCYFTQCIDLGMGVRAGTIEDVFPADQFIVRHLPAYGGEVCHNIKHGIVYKYFQVENYELERYMALMQKRQLLNHPNLLPIKIHQRQYVYPYLCGQQSQHLFKVEYLYLERSLQTVIEQALDHKQRLPQKLIAEIFSNTVDCLSYLKKNGTCHGDIKASTILLDRHDSAKLVDSYFVNHGLTSYELVINDPKNCSLLSPQQLQRLKKNGIGSQRQIYQQQIFSVGLTMIEAMTLQPAMECYDLDSMLMDEQRLLKSEDIMRKAGYSFTITQLAMRCVSIRKNDRPTFAEFLATLQRPFLSIPSQIRNRSHHSKEKSFLKVHSVERPNSRLSSPFQGSTRKLSRAGISLCKLGLNGVTAKKGSAVKFQNQSKYQ